MASGSRISAAEADAVARTVFEQLDCVCDEMHLAGSVRRGEPSCGDVDLVVRPRVMKGGVLAILQNRPKLWRVENKGLSVKTKQVKLTILEPTHCKAEVYLATRQNLGWILCLRTGPEEFTKELVTICQEWGFRFQKGHLYRVVAGKLEDAPLPVPREVELFETLGLEYITPSNRSRASLRQAAARRRQLQ